jgi:hypothetical protein
LFSGSSCYFVALAGQGFNPVEQRSFHVARGSSNHITSAVETEPVWKRGDDLLCLGPWIQQVKPLAYQSLAGRFVASITPPSIQASSGL